MTNQRRQQVIAVLVTIVLGFFFSVPLTFIAYAANGLLSGLIILGVMIGAPIIVMFVGWLVLGSAFAVGAKLWQICFGTSR